MTDETQTPTEEVTNVVDTANEVAEVVEAVVPAPEAAVVSEVTKVALDAFTNRSVLATRATVLLAEVKTLITHLEVETQTEFAKAVEQLKKYL